MDKQALRERVWDELEERGEARFPFPPHGRIPNFAGADEAAERVTGLDEWQEAATVKANPDAPQLPVRRRALRAGKTVYMAVPRLRDAECFRALDPGRIRDAGVDTDDAATIGGSEEHGVAVHPESMPPVDIVVVGSVAVTVEGARVGKGEGYSDLEFALLREFGLVDDDTTTVTTVHELQVVEEGEGESGGEGESEGEGEKEGVPVGPHDVPLDYVVTPERVIETGAGDKPGGVDFDALSDERVAEIPVLASLR